MTSKAQRYERFQRMTQDERDAALLEILAKHCGLSPRGAKWVAKVHKRLAGWCSTRGWECGNARLIGADQYEVWIGDRTGREAPIAFEMSADVPSLVDDYGMAHDFDAVTFDQFMTPHGLATKPVISKRQLTLIFSEA